MIINITKSRIFTVDPATRFSSEYGLSNKVWYEIWRRYKLLDYTNEELRDYIFVKYIRNLDYKTMYRWINRAEVYTIANPLIKKGVVHVNSSIFNIYEEYVINELTRPLKNGAIAQPKSIL